VGPFLSGSARLMTRHMSDPPAGYGDIVAQLGTGAFDVRYWSGRILLLEWGEPSGAEMEAVLAYVNELVEQGRPCWP